MYEIRDHPDAPDLSDLGEFLVEPVPPSTIRERRQAGDELVEVNLIDHEDLQVHVSLDPDPHSPGTTDIGTALYRLVQLFGTPQFDEYVAGEDVSWRDNETFKYLFEVRHEDTDDRWLITVHDWRVRLGVSLADWESDLEGEDPDVDEKHAIALLRLVTNIVTQPVHCEHKDIPY